MSLFFSAGASFASLPVGGVHHAAQRVLRRRCWSGARCGAARWFILDDAFLVSGVCVWVFFLGSPQAYMRALKRLKEQLKHWREECGCGFDPSLLSDVARQVTLFFFFFFALFCCRCRLRFAVLVCVPHHDQSFAVRHVFQAGWWGCQACLCLMVCRRSSKPI